ncbi:ATP-binding protein [Sphingobium yanoikuyae]|uniref:histidine kinase n=1 Tax=Sphingobium yanoikuyae TaxID=13690 RepID=A0A430BXT1_SPHYA|nr:MULTISPECIES: ATP-binding protein [Sphingobium]MDH2131418.1 ATP-binding protein [Sphingobium yanoikuyae]MDH2150884.1 ATP-binding protein [Sphingobium yanoikuyae]MDH2167100.1 ATP-binding protein [Sphingobium yanoikuyae]PZU70984.1 MAG: hybrid sensor histidine kinase/response regulator [Sphingobium sp.]QNG44418.1 response regulator [Sphingobium yanoikuyae]
MAEREVIDEQDRGWRAAARRYMPLVLGILLIGSLGALLYSASSASRDHQRALAEQQRSWEIMALARAFEAKTARAEVTLARYVISLDPDTGRLFQDQWRTAASQLKSLTYATRKSDWQRGNVRALQFAFEQRGKTLSEIGLRTTYDQKMGALAQFHQAGRSQDIKRLTALIDLVIQAENARLRERSLAVSLAGDRTELVGKTSRMVGLALLVCVLFALWLVNAAYTERRNARRMADMEAERADRLEEAVSARTSELSDAYEQLKRESAERAAAEDNLRQMQKMDAVGQLTGGIAHDFNNMLAVVVGGLELAKRKLRLKPAEAGHHLDNAMEGANRAAALTRRLLAFARSEPLLPNAVDPDSLLRGMADLVDRTIGDQIIVSFAHKASGWRIFVDQHQMENALLNLCVNARDAMEGRGKLTISTGQAQLAANQIGECPAGDYVTVSVTDNGCGMTAEVAARVFEPFFTTKPVGKGTGLGLSQIFGFVRQSQGEIRIESELGTGTSVHIYLPRRILTEQEAAAEAPASEQLHTLHPPTRILVVEDDPRVLNQTMAALAELGHLPIACDHPSKAAKLLSNNADIGLIMSDVLMPDMTGPEMIRTLPAHMRHLPVLFVTGFTGDATDSDDFRGHEVLRKPYTLNALGLALSNALSGSNHPGTAAAAE